MNEQRWRQVNRVLADCLGIAVERRVEHARRRCAGDEDLYREVRSLLRASTDANGYFESLAGHAAELTLEKARGTMIGRRVGHFTISGALGCGGMGDVYRAEDGRLQREVALKVLGKDSAGDPKMLARFDREAVVLAALNHPNIASIYGREEADGRPVLVLELVDGTTLADRLSSGPLPLPEALRIAHETARGLEAAHLKGIVHRDLKPSNVMLTAQGSVKILDFGIAKPLRFGAVRDDTPDLTATGVLLGTVPYMSPEQVRGQVLDQRADVWAFGCLLFEMLTGHKAFERDTVADTLAAIIEHEPRRDLLPSGTPKTLEHIITGALDKRLGDRLATIEEVRRGIESIIAEGDTGELTVTVGSADALARARRYVEDHAWQQAFDLLDPMFGTLEADDLSRLGQAAWWLGCLDRCIEVDQEAFSMYVAAADRVGAAAMAIRMADHNGRRLQGALARGWLSRAERLLDGEPPSPVHGWLLRALIQKANSEGDHEEALALAQRMLTMGAELGDRDLEAVAIQYQGTATLHAGRVAEGMSLIDEAAVTAISGELSPLATAIIYCNAIAASRSLADYQRAGEWTAAAKSWCDRQSIQGFPGFCRVARAEVMRLHGNWADAESEALRACNELESFAPGVARVAFHELGEVRLRRGDFEAARQAFDSSRQLGLDPQPGAALLKLAEGDPEGAASSIRRALDGAAGDRLTRARLLSAQVEIALRCDDFDAARVACADLDRIREQFDAPPVQAAFEQAYGALCFAEGDLDGARKHLREAISLWERANVPYECARARELYAMAYLEADDEACAQIELMAACDAYVRLGAVPDSRRAAGMLADQWR